MSKKLSDLYEVEEFIDYWNGAGRIELKARLKIIKNKITYTQFKNEDLAIRTLLK